MYLQLMTTTSFVAGGKYRRARKADTPTRRRRDVGFLSLIGSDYLGINRSFCPFFSSGSLLKIIPDPTPHRADTPISTCMQVYHVQDETDEWEVHKQLKLEYMQARRRLQGVGGDGQGPPREVEAHQEAKCESCWQRASEHTSQA